MTAIEFIKENGWVGAESDITALELGFFTEDDFIEANGFDIEELKSLVESRELVKTGLVELKKSMFSSSKDLEYVKNWLLTVSEKLLTEKGIKLKQAIQAIEVCGEKRMKIRIKTFNGELPSYLTVGKVYLLDTINYLDSGDIYCDNSERIFIQINECAFLNGGSWEVVYDAEF